MGLLAECKICRKYISAKAMDEHLRWKHGIYPSRTSPPHDANGKSPKGKTLGSKGEKRTNASVSMVAQKQLDATPCIADDPRVAKASLEQQARARMQAAKNRATANFAKDSALRELNKVPLSSLWKEQVAKLKSIGVQRRNEGSYADHLQSVPVREIPPPATPSGVKRSKKGRSQQSSTNATASINVPCSCGGENENCYRCYGSGYYEVSAAEAARLSKKIVSQPLSSKSGPTRFASDSRGGVAYGVRENGRFSSAPDFDDYGDESGS